MFIKKQWEKKINIDLTIKNNINNNLLILKLNSYNFYEVIKIKNISIYMYITNLENYNEIKINKSIYFLKNIFNKKIMNINLNEKKLIKGKRKKTIILKLKLNNKNIYKYFYYLILIIKNKLNIYSNLILRKKFNNNNKFFSNIKNFYLLKDIEKNNLLHFWNEIIYVTVNFKTIKKLAKYNIIYFKIWKIN